MERLSLKPQLFEAIRREYPTKPSKDNLVWWLERQGFSGTAASIAAASYLSTMALVESLGVGYGGENNAENEESGDVRDRIDDHRRVLPNLPPPGPSQKESLLAGERELTAGLLSKGAKFRLLVSGQIGVKEIERLIAKLEIDKEILAEADDEEEDLSRLA